jgi:hypothetical protein
MRSAHRGRPCPARVSVSPERPAPAVAALVARIADPGAPLLPDELRQLVRHPDERVPLALAEHRAGAIAARHLDVRLALYFRAIQDATRAGLVWTPLLDVLAATRLWPSGALAEERDRHAASGAVAPVLDLSERVVLVAAWVAAQADPDCAVPTLATRYAPLAIAVSRAVQRVTPAVARALLVRDPASAPSVAGRRDLTPDGAETLAAWAVARWTAAVPDALALRTLHALDARPEGLRPSAVAEVVEHAVSGGRRAGEAVELALGLRSLDGPTVESLLPVVLHRSSTQSLLRLLQHPAITPARLEAAWSRAVGRRAGLVDLILATPNVAPGVLHLVLSEVAQDDLGRRTALVQHPAAGPAVWRAIAATAGDPALLAALVARQGPRRDAGVRARLAEAPLAPLASLTKALRDSQGDAGTWRPLFLAVCARDLAMAARVLVDTVPPTGCLYADDLLPLLASTRGTVRDAALHALAQAGAGHPTPHRRRSPIG